METHVELELADVDGRQSGIRVRMLGPLTVSRHGTALQLPSSRKVRALFAYLAMAPHPVGRSRLCELLWDVPNDPRGELRWCLSKLRNILDETRSPQGRRVWRHNLARSRRLPCRRDRGRGRGPTGNRHARLEPAADPGRPVCRRLPGRTGSRPQSAFRQLADRPAPPLRRLPRRLARAPGGKPSDRIGRSPSAPGELG